MATYVITGANRGIGLELTRQVKAAGHEVIALCRSSSKELDALGVRVETGIDVGSDAVVDELRSRLGDVDIDVLINNAGVLRRTQLNDLDYEAMRVQFEINSLGPLRVVDGLQSRLGEGAKVALVTSRMGSIEDNDSGSHYGYRMSKAALNAAGKSLSVDLKGKGVSVAILHPGWVKTDMTSNNGLISAEESAQGLLARIDELTPETSGGFWHQNGERLPW